jgi:hypothetical protein
MDIAPRKPPRELTPLGGLVRFGMNPGTFGFDKKLRASIAGAVRENQKAS